jgi:hypothetical protein
LDQLTPFSDPRLRQSCVYCGGPTGTRDHVPSKVFLDEPYPENLPVVFACERCNAGFSLDEEYVACVIDSVLAARADACEARRHRIARILREKVALREMIGRARQESSAGASFVVDVARVRSVLLKLARGHAAYELDERPVREPALAWAPLASVDADSRRAFETPPHSSVYPEVGCRAMQRMAVISVRLASLTDPGDTLEHRFLVDPGWIEVQQGRYRYLAMLDDSGSVVVRFVLSEYLACEAIWTTAGSFS